MRPQTHNLYIMPKPYSNDLRKRVIDAKLRGNTEEKIALEKEISKSTVTKIWSLYRKTGNYQPLPNPSGRKPKLSEEQLGQIKKTIEEQPDTAYFVHSTSITLQELKDKFCLPISISALSKNVRFKLNLHYTCTMYEVRSKKNAIPRRAT